MFLLLLHLLLSEVVGLLPEFLPELLCLLPLRLMLRCDICFLL